MPFDAAAAQDFCDMVGYERFVLARALRTLEEFQGLQSPHHIELRPNLTGTIHTEIAETIGSGGGLAVLDFMRPLLFTAAFKILDQSVEWTLRVNQQDGVIARVPWRFVEKRTLLRTTTNLHRPPLCAAFAPIWDVLVGAFDNLTDFRNTVVHDHRFTLAPGVMTITHVPRPPAGPRSLAISDAELYALAHLAHAICEGLPGASPDHRDLVLAAAADCPNLHGRSVTRPPLPEYFRVTWSEPAQFPLDLDGIRGVLHRIFPGRGGYRFDLSLHAIIEGQRYDWVIPSDALAGAPQLVISPPDEWEPYRA